MPSRSDQTIPRISELRSQAAAERQHADQASLTAAWYESMTDLSVSGQLRGAYTAVSSLHRRAEVMHIVVARIAESQAARLASWLNDPDPAAARPRLVAVMAAVLGTPSVSAMMWAGGHLAARLSASDETSRTACETESLCANGPATAAFSAGRPVAAAGGDLAERWPLLGHAMAELGVCAAVAAPLGFPPDRLGAVCAYYRKPAVSEAMVAAVSHVAEAVTRLLQSSTQHLAPTLIARNGDTALIHQAAGRIAAQVGSTVGDAYDLLAARAYADGLPLAQAAAKVLSGSIRFEGPAAPTF